MSRIGNQLIKVPQNVEVTLTDQHIKVKGPKGELNYDFSSLITVKLDDGMITVTRKADTKESRAFHGLTRALISNMVTGVSTGFERRLQIIGVGYRAQASGTKITLNLGYSHPIEYVAPDGVTIEMDQKDKNLIIISGIDKQLVGEVAANIRKYRSPEPYKGKGIRYTDEHVQRKAGKTASKSS